ncbi:MAG: hypothetical protein ACRDGA_13320, partial [Bacteroidota bacterium]
QAGAGNRRVISFRVATVADGDTVSVNDMPEGIAWATVNFEDAGAVAADSVSVESTSGKVITFQVAGTARDCRVTAYGESTQGSV